MGLNLSTLRLQRDPGVVHAMTCMPYATWEWGELLLTTMRA